MNPRITVLLTTYNRPIQLQAAINSVITQTEENFELIILDDGSDMSQKPWLWLDDRISYHRLKHSGIPGISLNIGLELARGFWITWLCDDDLWKPQMLEKQLGSLAFEAACYTHAEGVHQCRTYEGWVYEKLIRNNFIPGTMMWHKALPVKFNEELRFRGYEDWLMWLDISKLTKISEVKERLRIQQQTPGSIGKSISTRQHYRTVAEIYKLYGYKPGFIESLRLRRNSR